MGNLVKRPFGRTAGQQEAGSMNHLRIAASALPKATLCVLFVLTVSCRVPSSGPPIGHLMPMIIATDLSGQSQIISSLRAPCVLFFFTPSCQPCNQLLEYLASRFLRKGSRPFSLFLVVDRGQKETLAHIPLHGFPALFIDQTVWRNTFQVSRTPVLLFYQAQGRLTRKLIGWRSTSIHQDLLEDLIQEARTAASPHPRLSDNLPVRLTQTNRRR